MCKRHRDHFADVVAGCERRCDAFDTQMHRRAHEAQTRVAQQRTRQQPRFTGDLEAVADREHGSTALGKRNDFLHDRTETSDRAGAEIVAIAETAGEDYNVDILKVVILVPAVHSFLSENAGDGIERILVAVGAGKADDAGLHACSTAAIS